MGHTAVVCGDWWQTCLFKLYVREVILELALNIITDDIWEKQQWEMNLLMAII